MTYQINDYTHIRPLGEGAIGRVELFQSIKGEKFAIKSLEFTNQNKLQTFQEAELYVKLNHPNIIKAREFFVYDQEKFLAIVLEYCPEGDLSKKIGQLQLDQSLAIMKFIAEGLIYLHKQKIIHRDLKPENILMKDGCPKIADMGFAKYMESLGNSSKMGALNYMAPQTFREDAFYIFQSDIYSLGLIYLELLTGKRIGKLTKKRNFPGLQSPFFSKEVQDQVNEKDYVPMLKKMLEKEPEERMRIQQVLEELIRIEIERKFKNKIRDDRKKIDCISLKQLYELISKDIYFPNLNQILGMVNMEEFGDQGLIDITKNAFKFPHLQEIYLPRNKITNEGITYFVKSDHFPKLILIGFSANQISDQGFIALAENGDKFPCLQVILLAQNLITDAGMKQVAIKGEKLKKLKNLDLSYNKITNEGLKELFTKGRNFPQLSEIDLDGNQFSQDVNQIVLKHNKNFSSLIRVQIDGKHFNIKSQIFESFSN